MVAVLAVSVALVVYVFAGYPALMALIARLRPRPPRVIPGYEPHVSLLILAFNEESEIEGRLRNVAELHYPRDRLEVLVVTDGSDDATPRRAAVFDGVRVLHQPERKGKLAAIERGVAASNGEILVFSDANNRYTPETLRRLVEPFADPNVGMVSGRKAIDDGSGRPLDKAEGLYFRYESRLKEWEGLAGSTVAVAGEILATRRVAYRSPSADTLNEDLLQALLVLLDGWRIAYAPQAVSLERASATMGDELTRRSRLTAGRYQAVRRIVPRLVVRRPFAAWQVMSHKGLRPLVPWALLSALLANLLIARQRAWGRALLGLQGAFLVTALLGAAQERAGRRDRLTYLPYYFLRLNLATLRGLRDALLGRQSAVWDRVRRG